MIPSAKMNAIWKYRNAILLTVIMAVAVWLRLENITTSLSRDEILMHQIAAQDIIAPLSHTFYPLSYVLVHYSLNLGDSEVAVRLPTFIAGLLGVWCIYFLGKAWSNRQTGLVAAFLLSISSIHIYYSADARFYTLLILAAIITLWMIIRALENPGRYRYWFGYAGAIALGSLTHPFFIPFLWSVGIGAFIAGTFRRRVNSNPTRFLVTLVLATLIGMMPWVLAYFRFQEARPNFVLNSTSPRVQERYSLTVLEYLQYYKTCLLYQQPGKGGLMLAFVILGAVFLWRHHRRWSLPVILVPVLFPLPFFFISVNHHFTLRYFTIHVPVALLLVSICLVQLSRYSAVALGRLMMHRHILSRQKLFRLAKSLQFIILIAILGILTATYLGKYLYDYHYREYWKEQAAAMAPYVSSDDVILYYAPYHHLASRNQRNLLPPSDTELGFYLNRMLGSGRRDRVPSRRFYAASTTDIDNVLRTYPHRTIWLVHRISPPIQRMSPAQNHLFTTLILGQKEIFQVAGAPTTNLISGGSIDGLTIADYDTSGSVDIVPVDASHKPGSCVYLRPGDDGSSASIRFGVHSDSATTGAILQSGTEYMLSLHLKYNQAEGDPQTTGSVRIDFFGKTADGKPVTAHVENFYGYSKFQFQAFPVNAATYPQLYHAVELKLQFSYTGNAGAMWVDNVQLERGSHPTPYTDGTRLPHDQALAKLEAQQ